MGEEGIYTCGQVGVGCQSLSRIKKACMHMAGVERLLDMECQNVNGRMAGVGKYEINLEHMSKSIYVLIVQK